MVEKAPKIQQKAKNTQENENVDDKNIFRLVEQFTEMIKDNMLHQMIIKLREDYVQR